MGIKKEETVAVFMEKGWEQVVAVYGILFAGAAYLPIDIHNPKERVEKILRDSGTRIILVQKQADEQGYRMAARVGLYFCVWIKKPILNTKHRRIRRETLRM